MSSAQSVQEIPVAYVRLGQGLSIAIIAAAVIVQMPLLLAALWLIQTLALSFGAKANVLYWLGRPFIGQGNPQGETQHPELLRFNTAIAVMMLCLALASFLLGFMTAGYVISILLGLAMTAALFGYCLGCGLYYRLKQ